MNIEKVKQTMLEFLKKDDFANSLGMEIIELTPDYGYVRIPLKKQYLNPYGSMHGGILYSIADIVAGTIGCLCGNYVSTISGTLNYLEPALNTTYVHCYVEKIREGKHILFFDVVLKNDDETVLDKGTFSFFKLDKKVCEEPS